MRSLNKTIYVWGWLAVVPLLIAGSAYYWTTPKAPIYQARTVYTIVPKTVLEGGNYQDMQATSLFMDVVKSWLASDNLQSEMKTKLAGAVFSGLRTLSMQTFELAVNSPDKSVALKGANALREIVYREVGHYTEANPTGGFVIYNFDPTVGQVFPKTWFNAGLGLLVGLVLGGFMVLLDKYYFKR